MRVLFRAWVITGLTAVLALLPSAASAQATASIAGAVTDASGAVLPGVTVEAASPALIEKVRTVVTDGAGQYRLEQLRGGVYTVTFTLPGFNTVKREGLELSGSFVATVNAEMRVGAVEETVTVTGESPIVDIQSANRQRVINQELLEAIPTGRTPQVAAFMIPGVNLNNVDVGGTNIINTTGGSMSIHGGAVGDTRILIDGITTANAEGTGWAANMLPNMGSTQEVSVDYSSASAESITGGLQINMIPKTGGNRYAGSLFATAVNSSFQGSNNTDELRARGLRTPNSLKLQYDINPGLGGPIQADKLWFYTSARFTRQANYIGGLFQNKNAFDITKWAYEPDENNPAFSDSTEESVNLRLTWQATQANKFSFFYDNHWRCQCVFTATTVAQEAAHYLEYPIQDLFSVSYTAALSSKVLVEARAGVRREEFAYTPNNYRRSRPAADSRHRAGRPDPGPALSGPRSRQRHSALPAHARLRDSLVGVDVLRHRRPLGQVRRLQRHRHPRLNGARQFRQADLPVQQRRAQPVDAAGHAATTGPSGSGMTWVSTPRTSGRSTA